MNPKDKRLIEEAELRVRAFRAQMRGEALRWRVARLNPKRTAEVIRKRKRFLLAASTYRDLALPIERQLKNFWEGKCQ